MLGAGQGCAGQVPNSLAQFIVRHLPARAPWQFALGSGWQPTQPTSVESVDASKAYLHLILTTRPPSLLSARCFSDRRVQLPSLSPQPSPASRSLIISNSPNALLVSYPASAKTHWETSGMACTASSSKATISFESCRAAVVTLNVMGTSWVAAQSR